MNYQAIRDGLSLYELIFNKYEKLFTKSNIKAKNSIVRINNLIYYCIQKFECNKDETNPEKKFQNRHIRSNSNQLKQFFKFEQSGLSIIFYFTRMQLPDTRESSISASRIRQARILYQLENFLGEDLKELQCCLQQGCIRITQIRRKKIQEQLKQELEEYVEKHEKKRQEQLLRKRSQYCLLRGWQEPRYQVAGLQPNIPQSQSQSVYPRHQVAGLQPNIPQSQSQSQSVYPRHQVAGLQPNIPQISMHHHFLGTDLLARLHQILQVGRSPRQTQNLMVQFRRYSEQHLSDTLLEDSKFVKRTIQRELQRTLELFEKKQIEKIQEL